MLKIRLNEALHVQFEAGHEVVLPDTPEGWARLRALLQLDARSADKRIGMPAAPTQAQLDDVIKAWKKSQDWLDLTLEEFL